MKKILFFMLLLLVPALCFSQTPPQVPDAVRNFLNDGPGTHKISVGSLLARLSQGEKVSLIDVRTAQEYAVMHPQGAISIPFDQLADHLDKIPQQGLVVVYCHSGRRAEGAVTVLRVLGYSNVVNLSGGIKALTPAITAKSAPPISFVRPVAPDSSPSPDDDEEEDFGC